MGESIIRIAHGPRAVEALLLQDLDARLRESATDLTLLATPIRVVVPSRSLRDHVSAVLVRDRGRPAAGIVVQTLYGLAREVLERPEVSFPPGRATFEVMVRRHAAEEQDLRAELEHLVDGYGVVAATVEDFLDAGFEAAHWEPLDERLADLLAASPGNLSLRRVRAILRVAARVWDALTAAGTGREGDLFRHASERIRQDPDGALPARAILVHGFADATGLAMDLLEALLARGNTVLYLDHPQDPAGPDRPDLGIAFTRRLAGRMERVARCQATGELSPAPQFQVIRAPGAHAEVRAVASRIQALLLEGVPAEGIGVVARNLTPYRIPLRLHFNRLGIPFSAMAARGPCGTAGRRARALLELLRRRDDCPVDRWLETLDDTEDAAFDASVGSPERPVRHDLRLAVHALGAARLTDLEGSLVPDALGTRERIPLPVRRGFAGEDGESDAPPRAQPRSLAAAALHETVARARDTLARLRAWRTDDFRGHVRRLWEVLHDVLLWRPGQPGFTELLEGLEAVGQEVSDSLELSFEEFVLVLGRLEPTIGAPTLGGAGGGVQVLDVVEARGRTFQNLFLVGLNLDAFPRIVREDPLLSDGLRKTLTSLLPDLPIKEAGFDEERYLFAQLLSSSPRVTLSWLMTDEDGRPKAPSPLLERLRLSHPALLERTVPPIFAVPPRDPALALDQGEPLMRPAHEHAVVAGLSASRQRFRELLPLALTQTGRGTGHPSSFDAEALAAARFLVLEEQDPDLRTPEGRRRRSLLGPYQGFVGPVLSPVDPRRGEVFVTSLEALASCPWQLFLSRILRLEPVPDPLEGLAAPDALLRGSVVHAVLEGVVRQTISHPPKDVAEAGSRSPSPAPWPDRAQLEAMLNREAHRVVLEAGVGLTGIERLLVAQARPFLDAAFLLEWGEGKGPPEVLGAELEGFLTVRDAAGQERQIRFKADRVDLRGDEIWMTDYKTGRPVSDRKKPETRRANFLKALAAGQWLQAPAYVLGAGGRPAQGRLVFLKPDLPEEARIFEVTAEDADVLLTFREVVSCLLDALERGSLFPRVVGPDHELEPRRCGYCELSQACLRGDSGARFRLVDWVERSKAELPQGRALSPLESAFLGVWSLGRRTPGGEDLSGQGEGP